MSSLVSRLLVAAILLPLVIGVVYLGGWWLFALALVGGLIALHELYTMARELRPLVIAGYLGFVLALLGLQLSNLVGGAVIIEVVFNWPGVGRLMIEALVNHDFPVIQAGVLLITACTVLVNLAIDMSYGLIDPRIRYQ